MNNDLNYLFNISLLFKILFSNEYLTILAYSINEEASLFSSLR